MHSGAYVWYSKPVIYINFYKNMKELNCHDSFKTLNTEKKIQTFIYTENVWEDCEFSHTLAFIHLKKKM